MSQSPLLLRKKMSEYAPKTLIAVFFFAKRAVVEYLTNEYETLRDERFCYRSRIPPLVYFRRCARFRMYFLSSLSLRAQTFKSNTRFGPIQVLCRVGAVFFSDFRYVFIESNDNGTSHKSLHNEPNARSRHEPM